MTYPGSLPGDPAGPQPGWQPAPAPGAYQFPPVDYGGAPQPPYSAPPPGYSPQQQMPPGAFPPPPPYAAYPPYNTAHPHPYVSPYPPGYGNRPATNGMAIGSLVSSLVGIPAYLLCMPFVGSIIGVVLGIVALNQIGKRHQGGKGMAIAGIAIGTISLLGALILVTIYSSNLFLY